MALSRRIGKHKALIAAFIYGLCVSPLMFVIPAGSTLFAAIVLVLTGVPYGAPAFLIRAMMADVADADTAENNSERAGLMYSFLSLTSKFGIGLSVFVTFSALALIGFDPKATLFAPDLPLHLRIVYVAIPVIFNIASLLALLGYPIDERRQRELRDEIERLRAAPFGVLEGDGVVENTAQVSET